MKNLLFFSNNINKVYEIKKIFDDNFIKLYTLKDFKFMNDPLESGKTFIENAKIKSEYGFKKTNTPTFADDSGICIEALENKPGVFSKRYLNSFKNQKACLKNILNIVKKKKKNNAYFKTSICLTIKENHNIVFEGTINGKISNKIMGKKGFGYDPIFIPNGHDKTFAEMSLDQKNSISHRSIAIQKLLSFIIE